MRFVQMIAKSVSDEETVIAVRDVTVEQDDNLRRLLLERITFYRHADRLERSA